MMHARRLQCDAGQVIIQMFFDAHDDDGGGTLELGELAGFAKLLGLEYPTMDLLRSEIKVLVMIMRAVARWYLGL